MTFLLIFALLVCAVVLIGWLVRRRDLPDPPLTALPEEAQFPPAREMPQRQVVDHVLAKPKAEPPPKASAPTIAGAILASSTLAKSSLQDNALRHEVVRLLGQFEREQRPKK
jgi:hypothetical protein